MKKKQTAQKTPPQTQAPEEADCFFMLRLSVPQRVAQWVRAEANAQGHGDISRVIRDGLDRLIARQQAGEIL